MESYMYMYSMEWYILWYITICSAVHYECCKIYLTVEWCSTVQYSTEHIRRPTYWVSTDPPVLSQSIVAKDMVHPVHTRLHKQKRVARGGGVSDSSKYTKLNQDCQTLDCTSWVQSARLRGDHYKTQTTSQACSH